MAELWTEVADFTNYEVSSLGQVRRKGKMKPLKGSVNGGGCLQVGLTQDGRQTRCLVQFLVAQAFLENLEGKCDVDHINKVKTDNRVENLRWATRTEYLRNSGMRPDNTSGYTHIYTAWRGKHEAWRIQIERIPPKQFSKKAWTLEQVVDIRNNLYVEHGLVC